MKKSEVTVCDICRQVITEKKCEICDKDICENCEEDMAIGLANGGILFYIITCKHCANKLEKSRLKQYFENEPHTKIRKKLLGIFRNAIVVENLQDSEELRADRAWMMNKIKREDTSKRGTKLYPFKPMKGGRSGNGS